MFFNCRSTTIKAQFRGSVLLCETFLTVGFSFKCSSLRSIPDQRLEKPMDLEKRKTLLEKGYAVRQQLTQLEVSPLRNWISFREKTATETYLYSYLKNSSRFASTFYFSSPIYLFFICLPSIRQPSNPIIHLIIIVI